MRRRRRVRPRCWRCELTERFEVIGRGHAGRLLPMADELLREAGLVGARSRRHRVRPRAGRVHGTSHCGGHCAGPGGRRRQADRAGQQPRGRRRRGRAARTGAVAHPRLHGRAHGPGLLGRLRLQRGRSRAPDATSDCPVPAQWRAAGGRAGVRRGPWLRGVPGDRGAPRRAARRRRRRGMLPRARRHRAHRRGRSSRPAEGLPRRAAGCPSTCGTTSSTGAEAAGVIISQQ